MNHEKRILKETEDLIKDPVPGIAIRTHPDNLRYFDIDMSGPPDTPYEGGVFNLELFLPKDYPMEPPKLRFLTKIFHPNIDKLGRICLDVIKERWTPALQVRTVLLSVQSLLASPNPKSPLNTEVAQAWRENEENARNTAREWTLAFATTAPPDDQQEGNTGQQS